ncbi:MmoB/DmpM family protein [Sneathiella litorea]|uniref:Monooxygenase n=1 Tax=Sneathiella litorea TaxID=2606216 RepID=A0A6L8W3Q2_9PROT|nr:MmoB/DmpM family protein [Sneathiella litorea]MZR29638.1 monooxygenase [Sneathiella litorea]
MANVNEDRYVGPVMRKGEIGDAVIEAIQEDNKGRDIIIEEHESYFRIKVEGECLLRFETVGDMLGSDVASSDIESAMPAFEGFIRVSTDQIRFLSK